MTSNPASQAYPLDAGSQVVRMRMQVDLPAPFGPRKPTSSPARTWKETSSTARTGAPPRPDGAVATRTYTPPAPPATVPAAFPDEFEVRVYEAEGGARLVAAVELVSPANKDREAHRRAFANKCARYLAQGISLIVIDVVTSRQANLHAEIMRLLGREGDHGSPADAGLYAV